MKKSQITRGQTVVLRPLRSDPSPLRCVQVVKVLKYGLEVEYLYGEVISQEQTLVPPGPFRPIFSAGMRTTVKLSDVVKTATVKDKKAEQENWDQIRHCMRVIERLADKGITARVSPSGWPIRLEVGLSREDAEKVEKVL